MSGTIVAEILVLCKAGLMPASIAAPLGAKECAAAFDEDHPVAWIQLRPPSTSSPKVSKFAPNCAAAPMDAPASKMFGYPCKTEKSFMLHVVCRGSMDNPNSWYEGKADFIQMPQLAMGKQAFAKYFYELPVGISPNPDRNILFIPYCASLSIWPVVKKSTVDLDHRLCFPVMCGLSCEDEMFAHPKWLKSDSGATTDVNIHSQLSATIQITRITRFSVILNSCRLNNCSNKWIQSTGFSTLKTRLLWLLWCCSGCCCGSQVCSRFRCVYACLHRPACSQWGEAQKWRKPFEFPLPDSTNAAVGNMRHVRRFREGG